MKLHGARRFVRKIQKLADKLKNRVRGPEGLKRTPMAEKLNQRLRGPEDLRRTLMAEKLKKRLRGPEDPQRIPMALIESVASIPMDAQLSIENDDGTPPSESESTRDTCFELARKQFGPAEIKPIASKTGPALIASTSSKYLGPHDQALSSSKNVASVTHKVERKSCDFSLVPLRKRPYDEEKGCQDLNTKRARYSNDLYKYAEVLRLIKGLNSNLRDLMCDKVPGFEEVTSVEKHALVLSEMRSTFSQVDHVFQEILLDDEESVMYEVSHI